MPVSGEIDELLGGLSLRNAYDAFLDAQVRPAWVQTGRGTDDEASYFAEALPAQLETLGRKGFAGETVYFNVNLPGWRRGGGLTIKSFQSDLGHFLEYLAKNDYRAVKSIQEERTAGRPSNHGLSKSQCEQAVTLGRPFLEARYSHEVLPVSHAFSLLFPGGSQATEGLVEYSGTLPGCTWNGKLHYSKGQALPVLRIGRLKAPILSSLFNSFKLPAGAIWLRTKLPLDPSDAPSAVYDAMIVLPIEELSSNEEFVRIGGEPKDLVDPGATDTVRAYWKEIFKSVGNVPHHNSGHQNSGGRDGSGGRAGGRGKDRDPDRGRADRAERW